MILKLVEKIQDLQHFEVNNIILHTYLYTKYKLNA